jgi:anti-anti-sigma factor
MLRITERPVGDVMIIDLLGTVDPAAGEVGVGEAVKRVRRLGYRKILLNLLDMTSSNTSSIRALLAAFSATSETRCELKLVNVDRRMKELLFLVGLHEHFEWFDSEREALESFERNSPDHEHRHAGCGAPGGVSTICQT